MSFPRYPDYIESGVAWLGPIPSFWEVARLGNECDTLVPMRDKPEGLDGPIPWIRIEDFNGKYVSSSKSKQGVSPDTVQQMNLKVLPEGTVLCSCSCSMGATAIVASPLVTNQTFIGVVPGPKFFSDYLYYYFLAAAKYLDTLSTGAIQLYLSRDDFRRLRLPKPALTEQVTIAAFLDRETAKIDALVIEQKRLIELLKEKRQAVISQAVTKGLDPNVPMKDSGAEWLGEVPAHWSVGSLIRVADRVVVGIAEAATHAYSDEGTPILRSTNIRAGRIVGDILYVTDEFADGRGSKLIKAGDLVTVRTGNAGVTAVVPSSLDGCQCFTMLITSLMGACVPEFYCYLFNSVSSQRYFSLEGWGTAQVNISVPILKALPVTVPSLGEQQAIVAHLDGVTERLDGLVAEAEAAMAFLGERRAALISAAVTGKIDVRGLVPQPEDAPA